jgi:hypothetical protein
MTVSETRWDQSSEAQIQPIIRIETIYRIESKGLIVSYPIPKAFQKFFGGHHGLFDRYGILKPL